MHNLNIRRTDYTVLMEEDTKQSAGTTGEGSKRKQENSNICEVGKCLNRWNKM